MFQALTLYVWPHFSRTYHIVNWTLPFPYHGKVKQWPKEPLSNINVIMWQLSHTHSLSQEGYRKRREPVGVRVRFMRPNRESPSFAWPMPAALGCPSSQNIWSALIESAVTHILASSWRWVRLVIVMAAPSSSNSFITLYCTRYRNSAPKLRT